MTIKQAFRKLTRSNRRTPEQIAKYLYKLYPGVSVSHHCGGCPVMAFFMGHGAGHLIGAVWASGLYGKDGELLSPHPPAVKEFIRLHDGGRLKELRDEVLG